MADYSNLSKTTANMIAQYVDGDRNVQEANRKKNKPTDEMLLEALENLSPPLLDKHELATVISVLRRELGRRPKSSASVDEVSDRLTRITRQDAPPAFLLALSARLKTRRFFTDEQYQRKAYKLSEQRTRDMFIRAIYNDLKGLTEKDGVVVHPIIGKIEVPPHDGSRSDRNLELTRIILQKHLATANGRGFRPPEKAAMRNLISKRGKVR